jgi:hypothetical protein
VYVKPKKGALVRDPVSFQPLPEQGREVPDNGYWRRRLADGDVELVNHGGEKKPAAQTQDVEPRS